MRCVICVSGGGYWFLDHSLWNGLTVADLVFPWFIFMMGTSMALSFKHYDYYYSKPDQLNVLLPKVLWRSCNLLALSLFLGNGYDLKHWRFPGVLARFSISYAVNALTILYIPSTCQQKHIPNNPNNPSNPGNHTKHVFIQHPITPNNPPNNPGNPSSSSNSWYRDITAYSFHSIFMLILVALWVGLTFGISVPGCGMYTHRIYIYI